MKRILLLFIPLMFFFSCKDNDASCLLEGDAWTLNYIINPDLSCTLFCGTSEANCTDWSYDDTCSTFQFNADGTYEFIDGGDVDSGFWDSACDTGNVMRLDDNSGRVDYVKILALELNLLQFNTLDGEVFVYTR